MAPVNDSTPNQPLVSPPTTTLGMQLLPPLSRCHLTKELTKERQLACLETFLTPQELLLSSNLTQTMTNIAHTYCPSRAPLNSSLMLTHLQISPTLYPPITSWLCKRNPLITQSFALWDGVCLCVTVLLANASWSSMVNSLLLSCSHKGNLVSP